jgi:hypothetical protein
MSISDKPQIAIFKTKVPGTDFEYQINKFLDTVTGPIQIETATLGEFFIVTIIY